MGSIDKHFRTPQLDNRNAVRIEVFEPADGEKEKPLLGFKFTAKHAIVAIIAIGALAYMFKKG